MFQSDWQMVARWLYEYEEDYYGVRPIRGTCYPSRMVKDSPYGDDVPVWLGRSDRSSCSSLKEIRCRAGVTRPELVKMSGVSKNGIYNLERGLCVYSKPKTIDCIARALGMGMEELILETGGTRKGDRIFWHRSDSSEIMKVYSEDK